MIKGNTVIGLAGVAGCGKDTFLALLANHLPNVKRFALADNLKAELNPFFKEMYGIDIFTCSREIKDVLRPILVAHGKMRRDASKGTHWTSLLEKEIIEWQNSNPEGIAVVTDIRYDVYGTDEVTWLKKKMNGTLVHIQRWYPDFHVDYNGKPFSKDGRCYIEAPNEDERINDPKLIKASDYRVIWPTALNKTNNTIDLDSLNIYAQEFVKYLQR